MPELPEVETTLRGILPHLLGRRVLGVEIRQRQLRWPVAPEIDHLPGSIVTGLHRRAKYLLATISPAPDQPPTGTILIHLGMSGSLRIIEPSAPLRPHDHVLVTLESGRQLRFHDPRRFGCWLWTAAPADQHPLLRDLGPEPLSTDFTGATLATAARGRRRSIKELILDGKVVVGVGNIYACEALHMAGIHPKRPAGRVGPARLERLADSIRQVLSRAIASGGTTLRDFLREDGAPGYFKQELLVYDREGEPCRSCQRPVRRIMLGQRSTFYCPGCQR